MASGTLLAIALATPGLLPASVGHGTPGDLPATLDGRFRAAFRSPFAARRALAPAPDGTVGCFVEGPVSPQALEHLGARLGATAGTRRTMRIPAARLLEAARLPGVRRISPALPMTPQLDLSGNDTRATLVHQGSPDTPNGVQGNGVLVGIIDSGIDWSHADFKKLGGTTRIRAIWDQQDPIGPPPAGYPYGTAWTQAQIDMGMCRERDSTYYGHGTHVAGIAVGSGRGTGNGWPQFTYVGVAPRADIIAVNTTFDDVDIADGIAWVFAQATTLGKPAVVNLSLGSDYGPHDGTGDLDQFINAVSGPGRMVVASAGNSNGKGRHGERIVPTVGDGVLSFRIFGYTPSPSNPDGISVDLWYEGGDNHMVTVRTPGGFSVGPVAKGGMLTQATPDGWVSIDATQVEGTHDNGDVEVLVEVSDAAGVPPASGDFEVRFTRVSGSLASEVDGWIYDFSFPFPPAFVSGKEEAELVISPSTADSAICVAAHTTRASWQAINGNVYNYGQTLNQIGTFSSPGPRRDAVAKPDLSAPGTAIGAAHSVTSLPNPTSNVLPDGVHKILQGTSMSAPQVAGAAALLLSRWPMLSATQVRTALMQSARADGFTGGVPNNTWGAGKLDLDQLFRQRLAFTTTVDPARAATPGSSVGLLELCAMPAGGTWSTRYRVRVSDSQGWLKLSNGGPPVAVALYDTITSAAIPGQARCAPLAGTLLIAIPPGTPNGTSTTVTFQVEPEGVPWMGVTRVTTVTVSTTSDVAALDLPKRLTLASRPRPVDGSFELEMALPHAGHVRLDAYDVTGRLRATLVDRSLEAGWTRIPWTGVDDAGRRLAAGVYLLRLVSPDGTASGRVVLTPG
ncbi:MAG TPA: S8 family serine peptidase [Candidatus Eisenbacteria bacterium]